MAKRDLKIYLLLLIVAAAVLLLAAVFLYRSTATLITDYIPNSSVASFWQYLTNSVVPLSSSSSISTTSVSTATTTVYPTISTLPTTSVSITTSYRTTSILPTITTTSISTTTTTTVSTAAAQKFLILQSYGTYLYIPINTSNDELATYICMYAPIEINYPNYTGQWGSIYSLSTQTAVANAGYSLLQDNSSLSYYEGQC